MWASYIDITVMGITMLSRCMRIIIINLMSQLKLNCRKFYFQNCSITSFICILTFFQRKYSRNQRKFLYLLYYLYQWCTKCTQQYLQFHFCSSVKEILYLFAAIRAIQQWFLSKKTILYTWILNDTFTPLE